MLNLVLSSSVETNRKNSQLWEIEVPVHNFKLKEWDIKSEKSGNLGKPNTFALYFIIVFSPFLAPNVVSLLKIVNNVKNCKIFFISPKHLIDDFSLVIISP